MFNKLKKDKTTTSTGSSAMDTRSPGKSRTLQYAQEMTVPAKLAPVQPTIHVRVPTALPTNFGNGIPMPISPTAQYWASRALSAETMLAAHDKHRKEQQALLKETEERRNTEIARVSEHHENKHAMLEKLVMLLAAFLVLLLGTVLYLVTHQTQKNAQQGAFHFTIPILSPFASVVENETSAMNSKTISLALVLIATVSYLLLRQRISRIIS